MGWYYKSLLRLKASMIRQARLTRCLPQTPPRSAVDVVVVIGHEKLTIEMQKLLGGYGVSVISAPKSSGVSSL